MAVVAMVGMSSCAERVDAGHEGILVNLYGDDKGVGDISMCTGYQPCLETFQNDYLLDIRHSVVPMGYLAI